MTASFSVFRTDTIGSKRMGFLASVLCFPREKKLGLGYFHIIDANLDFINKFADVL